MRNYGIVLDGRESEIVTVRPNAITPGDLKVRFDGWLVRGDRVLSVEKVGGGKYTIRLETWATGHAHTLHVHANSRIEIVRQLDGEPERV